MNTIYTYFKSHKWLLLIILLGTFAGAVYYGMQCKLEENIFKLLPKPEKSANVPALAFSNIKLKDKIFVQASHAEGEDYSEMLAEAMDTFMEKVWAYDQEPRKNGEGLGAIENTLSEIDPFVLLEAGTYLMEHGSAYLDFTDEEMNEWTSAEHVEQQVQQYLELMDTDLGEQLYDIIAYDPCGIVMGGGLERTLEEQSRHAGEGRTDGMKAFQHNHIFTKDGEACLGFITPSFGTDDSKKAARMEKNLERAKADVEEAYPGVKIMWHGTVIMSAGNSLRIKKDIATTIGVSLVLILLVLAWAFKRPTYWGLLLAPIVYSIMLALGLIFVARGWMSFMALGIGAIVLGVAMSYCLHVIVHYVYVGDVEATIKAQAKPVLMGSITTIGAFLGLLATSSSLLQDFGAFASLVIVGTTLFSLIAMPHFFPKHNDANRRAFAVLEKINSYEIDKNKWVCGIVFAWVIACCCSSGKYEFDANLRNINYISPEVREAMDSWSEKMNDGLQQQYYASFAETTEEALEQLPRIEALVDSLREAGVVKNTIRISGMLPSLSKQEERNAHWMAYFTEEKQAEVWRNVEKACAKNGIDADWFEPFKEKMAATEEPELLSEAGILPDEILGNFIENVDGTAMVYFPIKTTMEDAKGVKDVLTKMDGCMVLDPYYYSTDLVELIHSDFTRIMLISSLFVLLLLLVTYRNFWVAMIVFLPMTLSWYTVLGAMALFHQPFNMINTVVSAFVFGIGVDYSIFIMDGLLHGEKKTMASHKTAITLSATVLITCMFSLVFAVHPSIHSIAFASLVGMITTMMLSYTLQPNLYRLYLKIKDKRQKK